MVTGALLFFSLGCVYLCSHLPCTFDGWATILDFYLQVFSLHFSRPQAVSLLFCKSSGWGSEFSTLIQERVFQEPWRKGSLGLFHTPLSLQSYASDVMVCNPLVRQVHVYSFMTQEWFMINIEHYIYNAYSKLHIIVALHWSQKCASNLAIKDICPISYGDMANFSFLLCMDASASFCWLHIYSQKAIWKIKSGKFFWDLHSN